MEHISTLKIFSIHCSGFVDHDKIECYETNRERFISKGRGLDFNDAVKKMDEFISNPSVCITKYFF